MLSSAYLKEFYLALFWIKWDPPVLSFASKTSSKGSFHWLITTRTCRNVPIVRLERSRSPEPHSVFPFDSKPSEYLGLLQRAFSSSVNPGWGLDEVPVCLYLSLNSSISRWSTSLHEQHFNYVADKKWLEGTLQFDHSSGQFCLNFFRLFAEELKQGFGSLGFEALWRPTSVNTSWGTHCIFFSWCDILRVGLDRIPVSLPNFLHAQLH